MIDAKRVKEWDGKSVYIYDGDPARWEEPYEAMLFPWICASCDGRTSEDDFHVVFPDFDGDENFGVGVKFTDLIDDICDDANNPHANEEDKVDWRSRRDKVVAALNAAAAKLTAINI
jgi:hypothetical protein